MKLAYLDCISGISGDMLLAALVDAGWNKDRLTDLPAILKLDGTEIAVREAFRNGLRALKLEITPGKLQPPRTMKSITAVINESSIPEDVKKDSLSVLRRLAAAEAKIHGCSMEDVHFHEIGALDTIIDITGALLAFRELGISRVSCSPLPVSRGIIESDHGLLPLPAPAVLDLIEGVPVYPVKESSELVTPTGAAIVRHVADTFGTIPEMKITGVGYGAGSRDLESLPNVLRVILGESPYKDRDTDTVAEISTVIDDMTPEQVAGLMDAVFQKGALDAWVTPVHMKKNRAGLEFTAICHLQLEDDIARCILLESSSIGLRIQPRRRILLERRRITVMTRWGPVESKLVRRPGGLEEIIPEFDSCKQVAERFHIPLRMVYLEAIKAGAGWENR